MLGRCAVCLMRFSVDKRAASEIFHKNAIELLTSSIDLGGDSLTDDSINNALCLIERLIYISSAISEGNCRELMPWLTCMLQKRGLQPLVAISTLKILEHLSAAASVDKVIIHNFSINLILTIFEESLKHFPSKNIEEHIVSPITNILLHLTSKSSAVLKLIQDAGFVEKYLFFLKKSAFSGSKMLLRKVGELLSRLVDIDAQSLLNNVFDIKKNFPSREIENSIHLFLAIYGCDNSIVLDFKEDYVHALVQYLNGDNLMLSIPISKLLRLISTHQYGADILIDLRWTKILNHILLEKKEEMLVVNLLVMIMSITQNSTKDCSRFLKEIEMIVIEVLNIHCVNQTIIFSGLKTMSLVESKRADVELLSSLYEDYPTVLVRIVQEHCNHEEIQLEATIILRKLLSLKRFADSIQIPLLETLLNQVLCNILEKKTLLIDSLELVTCIIHRKEGLIDKSIFTIISITSSAIIDNCFSYNIITLTKHILKSLTTNSYVQRLVGNLVKFLDKGIRKDNEVAFVSLLKILCALTVDRRHAKVLKDSDVFLMTEIMLSPNFDLSSYDDDMVLVVIESISFTFQVSGTYYVNCDLSSIILCLFEFQRINSAEITVKFMILLKYVLQNCDKECMHDVSVIVGQIIVSIIANRFNESIVAEGLAVLTTLSRIGFQCEISFRGIHELVARLLKNTALSAYGSTTLLSLVWFTHEFIHNDTIVSTLRDFDFHLVLIEIMTNRDVVIDKKLSSCFEKLLPKLVNPDEVTLVVDEVKQVVTNNEPCIHCSVASVAVPMAHLVLFTEWVPQRIREEIGNHLFILLQKNSKLNDACSMTNLSISCLHILSMCDFFRTKFLNV